MIGEAQECNFALMRVFTKSGVAWLQILDEGIQNESEYHSFVAEHQIRYHAGNFLFLSYHCL